MLTPQEVEAQVFPKASFGGYNMLQVDAFFGNIVGDYRTLYQENLSLKNKLKVLVDKVEEYRATEDAMRRALHSAQKMAEEMVREGEAQKKAAIDEAVTEVKRQSEETRSKMQEEEAIVQAEVEAVKTALANEQARLDAARASTTAYVGKLKELYTKELEYIGGLSALTVQPAKPAPAAPMAPTVDPTPAAAPNEGEVAKEIDASMNQIFEPTAKKSEVGDTRAFDQIQYGKDYEIE